MDAAAHAMTMHTLTQGRYSFGLGRGIAPMFKAYGLEPIKTAQIEDFVGLMRRIWAGEIVAGHEGPAGRHDGLPQLVDASPVAQEDLVAPLAAPAGARHHQGHAVQLGLA